MVTPSPVHGEAARGVEPSPLLRAKLAALRRRRLGVLALTGAGIVVAGWITLLALQTVADWWIELPWVLRLLLLAAQLAALGFALWRLILRPYVRGIPEDDLALEVERAMPDFSGRLIAAVQLARPNALPYGASVELVHAVVEQAETAAAPADFRSIVPLQTLKRSLALGGVVLVAGVVALFLCRPTSLDLLARVFLSNRPVPRHTRVVIPGGDLTIGQGDSVRLEALAQGVVPTNGVLVIKASGRMEQSWPMDPDPAKTGRFWRSLDNVQESFTYRVRLNDGRSGWHQVSAVPRPSVDAIACEQEFPAYTGLTNTPRSLGDLALLAGSRLKLNATATKDLRSATLKLSGVEQSLPLKVDAKSPRQLSGEIQIPTNGVNGFSIQMVDTVGMESRDAVVYRVEIVPDKAPACRLTYPDRKEELITRSATLLVGMDLADDFAIRKVRLHYRVEKVPGLEPKPVELDLESAAPKEVRRRYEWKIAALQPPVAEGSRIEFWIEAEDNNNVTGPGIGVSEHQFAKIVSEEEKRADLLNRAGDYLGSINDVATDQDELNRSLGTVIRAKFRPAPAPAEDVE